MPTRSAFNYAIVRVVPRVERGEFLNVGAIVFSRTLRFLDARIELDEQRLGVLAPTLDPAPVQQHLAIIPRICAGSQQAGTIGQMPQHERFRWLVAPRSTIVQTSPVHSGLCTDAAAALNHLFDMMVRPPT
jgi:hypothetical protein